MKKYIKLATAALILFSILNLTGCWNPIFYELRKDVKPESATVSGHIPQITRFTADGKEYLFLTADGGIRYKEADNRVHGSWAVFPAPDQLSSYNFESGVFVGQQVISIYANSTTLYAVTAAYTTTGSEGTSKPAKVYIYGRNTLNTSEKWTLINSDPNVEYFPIFKDLTTDYYFSNFNMFQTNTPQAAHRHFYFCTYNSTNATCKYYEVTGTSTPVEISITSVEDNTGAAGTALPRVYSAAYFNGGIKFFNSRAVTTNETYTAEATRLYYGLANVLMYSDGTTYKAGPNAGDYISALATCSDSILIGRGATSAASNVAGITKATLDENGVPGSSITAFTTNASFQMTNIYPVLALLNATPSNTELNSSLYATITFYGSNGVYNNIGLWSYYPERGNWNRE